MLINITLYYLKTKMSKQIEYSYQDCWDYALSLQKNILDDKVKNDLIILCQTTSEKFWLNFNDKILTFSDYSKICHNLFRYLNDNYPIPYLVNEVFFYEMPFCIEEGVLIPQKDTEILVEKTKELAEKIWSSKKKLKFLDIGTGCGNIAISLAKDKPNWNITAIDINKSALKVAQINAKKQKLTNIQFRKSNLFDSIDSEEIFDVVVSNPPYISADEYQKLSVMTRQQPFEALVAENNGYYFYKQILQKARSFLSTSFLIVMEIGHQQKEKVIKFIIEYFPNSKVSIFADYQGHSRVIAVYRL
ncbi:MAG: Release factor glutamine methyltransferase [Mycoplasmataceae bacterium]|nr:MAG: Release factor glutamine methyltransferase [Mycoplasmataceae bacterium]